MMKYKIKYKKDNKELYYKHKRTRKDLNRHLKTFTSLPLAASSSKKLLHHVQFQLWARLPDLSRQNSESYWVY